MTKTQTEYIRANINRILPYIREGEFTVCDLDHGFDRQHDVQILRALHEEGIVEKIDYVVRHEVKESVSTRNNNRLVVWAWDRDALATAQGIVQKMNKLPCQHRAHVYHNDTTEGFGCKYCTETVAYDRETVKKALG